MMQEKDTKTVIAVQHFYKHTFNQLSFFSNRRLLILTNIQFSSSQYVKKDKSFSNDFLVVSFSNY